jgi:glutamyl-tRNA(Gln) amidotransferase subunit D
MKNIKAGKTIKIKTKEKEFQGTLIESYDPNIILLKLPSGYNIGIEKRKIKSIKEMKQEKEKKWVEEKIKVKELKLTRKKLPGIAIILTGGTISSKLDYKTGAVKPIEKPEEILAIAPKLNEIAHITKIEKPFLVFSEDMAIKEWQVLAKLCEKLLNKKENQGVIILQGTDTIHYTAAVLSFMLRDLNKPVIITYAQRSIDRGSSDSFMNLTCSAYAALSNLAEVMVVGHGTTHDNYCLALQGTKVRKMHTSRRDTFRPINTSPFAKIYVDGRIEKIREGKKRNNAKVRAEPFFNDKVILIKWHPNLSSKILDYYIKQNYKGIIIEATGLGHVPKSWLKPIEKTIKKGTIVCFAPQCLYGTLNPFVYETGRKLKKAGIIFLKDILPETAYIKLGWLLGKHKNKNKIKELMLKNFVDEFNERLTIFEFMY